MGLTRDESFSFAFGGPPLGRGGGGRGGGGGDEASSSRASASPLGGLDAADRALLADLRAVGARVTAAPPAAAAPAGRGFSTDLLAQLASLQQAVHADVLKRGAGPSYARADDYARPGR
jgi:hypothetical protein